MSRFLPILILLIFLGGIAYTLRFTWHLLPFPNLWKAVVVAVMAACLLMLFAQFLLGIDNMSMPLATAIYEVGNSSLFILLYMVILFIILQVLEALHVIPHDFICHSWKGTATVAVILTGVFTYGYFHYMHKERVPMEITTEKHLDRPLKIVMLSDLHLGYHNRIAEVRRWISLINAEHPDLVLIAGDIIDGHMRPLIDENMAAAFHMVKAPIVACLGNHEYFTGINDAIRFYHDAGITLLRDSAIIIRGVNIIGRDDRTNSCRKTVSQLMYGVDRSRYTILLDHQPFHLEEAQRLGIDLQLSGHTHYGQVWPISWITDAIYEDAWGPLQKGHTHYYVSSGIGIWGAKFRIGTQSEYAIVELEGK